jgi:hypothetical protein
MKIRKKGAILLALVLVAMTLVPIVSAIEQSANAASIDDFTDMALDASKVQLPQLVYDNNQKPIIMTDEMSLDKNIQSSQIVAMMAEAQKPAVSKIPFGTIIHHSKNGRTTVFDSTGKQLFVAEDAKASMINTFRGPAPATYIQEVPDKSVIIDSGNRVYVYSNKTLILSVIDESDGKTSSSLMASSTSGYPAQYIEGAETQIIPAVGQFTARWNVPTKPQLVKTYPPSGDPYQGSAITIWNGLYGFVGTDPDSRLIQPVLEWYIKDKITDPNPSTPQWTMATWYVWGKTKNDFIHSTRRTSVYSSDLMQGNIQLNTMGYDAVASIADL